MKFRPKVSIKKVFVAHRNSVENGHRFTFTQMIVSCFLLARYLYQMKFYPKSIKKVLLHIAVL
jgi:hypothetical protein